MMKTSVGVERSSASVGDVTGRGFVVRRKEEGCLSGGSGDEEGGAAFACVDSYDGEGVLYATVDVGGGRSMVLWLGSC